ncbi:hypothetical protein LTR56_017601 [Elasticomyces elasticus]|nr:hypothetical protein LTR56_017601 [Elasticomyces elasticus]KAK3630784.1 hypothetical protein LTR22_021363 [Elasticomyces elasticus]KAK4909198.1 hypothetical protein LTR49_022021 [Elasticomyces elasticus]KAK5749271.1 hypothetical protein LTS12_020651 [Elasticomyces elasticus]
MVSTRRTAHIEPPAVMAAADIGNTLRKKPVRRAPAKKPDPEVKPRTTRGGKAASPTEDMTTDTMEAPIPALQAKPMRRGPGRPKKEVSKAAIVDDEPGPPARATRTTKATVSKAKSSKLTIAEPRSDALAQEKPTRRTRATATKAVPLSPKKVTQVTNARLRNAKRDAEKMAAGKNVTSQRTVHSTTGTRKRPATDENAEVSIPTPAVDDDVQDLAPSTPAKASTPRRKSVKSLLAARSEASMSSRGTTPSQSPAPSFEHLNDANEYYRSQNDREDKTVSEPDSSDELDDSNEHSADELCGPKTPMKRTASAGAEARFLASIQKSKTKSLFASARKDYENVEDSEDESVNISDVATSHIPTSPLQDPEETILIQEEAYEQDVHGQEEDQEKDQDDEQLDQQEDEEESFEQEASEQQAYEQKVHDQEDLQGDDHDAHDQETESTVLLDTPKPTDSFDTDDTVLVHDTHGADDDSNSEDIDVTTVQLQSPTPETIIWDNLREDVTVPLDLAAHFIMPARFPTAEGADQELARDIQHSVFSDDSSLEEVHELHLEDNEDEEGTHESADGTVNLGDFVDFAALAEPTQACDVPSQDGDLLESGLQALTEPGVVDPIDEESADVEEAHAGGIDAIIVAETPSAESEQEPNQQHAADLGDGSTKGADAAVFELGSNSEHHEQHSPHAERDVAPATPHYALPTAAFDARRKSLPAITYRTPVKAASRPNTSDGASAPRMRFAQHWPLSSLSESTGSTVAISTPKAKAATASMQGEAVDAELDTLATPKHGKTPPVSVTATPIVTPRERYPRMTPRVQFEDHAKTAVQPARFHTPVQKPSRRPATTRKAANDVATPRLGSLRKLALKNNTPLPSHTPIKTPIKPPAMTPSEAPMTPHPAAPLRGVVAMVEVYTLEGASASSPFIALLRRLGAKTTKVWSDSVTHVIFKDGSPTTLQRVRLQNKNSGAGTRVHCVNCRWISDCEAAGSQVDEEIYAVDLAEVPRAGGRRRKSMEPCALINVGGNIVRRSSFGRSHLEATPTANVSDKENIEEELSSSPATPAYLAAPDKLIQQTAPINRTRKLGSKTKNDAKLRRLTFFNSAA